MRTAVSDRVAGAIGAATVLLLIGWVLILGLGIDRPRSATPSSPLVLIEAQPPKQPVERRHVTPRVLRPSARGSPPNLKNRATPIEAPPPPPMPQPQSIVVAEKPATDVAAETGNAARPGLGTGAGGRGGGSGSGTGGDGDGDTPPQQVKGALDFSDVPRALRDGGVGGTVIVRYHVEANGRVSECGIDTSSGNATLDALTCTLIERRFRFAPARDETGRPFRSTVVQRHSWINELRTGRAEHATEPR